MPDEVVDVTPLGATHRVYHRVEKETDMAKLSARQGTNWIEALCYVLGIDLRLVRSAEVSFTPTGLTEAHLSLFLTPEISASILRSTEATGTLVRVHVPLTTEEYEEGVGYEPEVDSA